MSHPTPTADVLPTSSCPPPAHRYHVLLYASGSVYQEWQTRVAYYSYLKVKAQHACSTLGNFTRVNAPNRPCHCPALQAPPTPTPPPSPLPCPRQVLGTPGARPDRLMHEIPTLLVSKLRRGSCNECDHGYLPLNRPWGLLQLLQRGAFSTTLHAEFFLLLDPDHLLLRSPPISATPTRPLGFRYAYMMDHHADAASSRRRNVTSRYVPTPSLVDPVGAAPVIIHRRQLERVLAVWWPLCQRLKRDPEADAAFGWAVHTRQRPHQRQRDHGCMRVCVRAYVGAVQCACDGAAAAAAACGE
jgi:hypothetical protein